MLKVGTPLTGPQEAIVSETIGCGIAVHRTLGPGFKEIIYHRAFRLELESRGLPFESDERILVKYREWSIPGQQIDLVVAGLVLVELKAVPRLRKWHQYQVRSYLRTTGLPVGLLLNFNAPLLVDGMRRVLPYDRRSAARRRPPAGADRLSVTWSSRSSSCSSCSSRSSRLPSARGA